MLGLRLLPWEYGVRNLFRRPLRTALTFAALSTVVFLVLIVAGFIRGLEKSLEVSGDPQVAIVSSQGMGENLEYSSIAAGTPDYLTASVNAVQTRFGLKHVSPELYLGTMVKIEGTGESMGLVRGVQPSVLLVRRQVELVDGKWPGPSEILVGRLAPTKLGATKEQLAVGRQIELEGKKWTVSGTFAARGSVFEAELWCRLDDLQRAMKREDLSLVALTLDSPGSFGKLQAFCKERYDLELQAIREPEYFAGLQRDYGPIKQLSWLVVVIVSAAGVFSGLNTMYGSVVGRVRELATLQAIGFLRRAIVVSLVQEGTLLAAAASLAACLVAFAVAHGAAVKFTMGAFVLQIDGAAVLLGCLSGIAVGVLGSLPAAIRIFTMQVVEALKAI